MDFGVAITQIDQERMWMMRLWIVFRGHTVYSILKWNSVLTAISWLAGTQVLIYDFIVTLISCYPKHTKKKTYFLLRRNISPKKEMANSQLDHLTWPLQVFTFESKHSAVDVVAIGLEEGYKKWSISKILVSYNI